MRKKDALVVEPSNYLLNALLDQLAVAGTLRLRVVLDLQLEDYRFVNQVGEHPRSPTVTSAGSGQIALESRLDDGLDEPASTASSEYLTYGEPLYELDRTVQPPRIGSMNAAVLTLLKQLPPSFTRDQFESVIPRAMNYNAATGQFGVRTAFTTIKRAQQAYFSEFRKRRWVVPFNRGVTLTARLLDDGRVITCLSGLQGAHPPPSKPQHFDMLMMQLNNSPLSLNEKEVFVKALRENSTAEIFLPRHNSQFFVG